MARVSKELREIKKMIDEETIVNMEIDKNLVLTLQENAVCLTDNRLIEYTYHSLESILLIVIFGIMARCNTFVGVNFFSG